MPTFKIGERICHPDYGEGTVTFVGSDYIGVEFDGKREALLRIDSFTAASPDVIPEPAPAAEATSLPWPESTFVFEKPGTRHYMGSHWDPFVDDVTPLLKRLPEIVRQWLMQTGFGGSRRKTPRKIPDDWPRGWHFAWPLRDRGLMLTLRIGKDMNEVVSLYPFFTLGSQHTVVLNRVTVREGGCEAQITASIGDAEIAFFDTHYLINRDWYESGREYDFLRCATSPGQ